MVPRVSAPTPQAQVPSPDPEWQHRTLDKPPEGDSMEHKDSFMRFAVVSAIVLVGALGLFVHFHS